MHLPLGMKKLATRLAECSIAYAGKLEKKTAIYTSKTTLDHARILPQVATESVFAGTRWNEVAAAISSGCSVVSAIALHRTPKVTGKPSRETSHSQDVTFACKLRTARRPPMEAAGWHQHTLASMLLLQQHPYLDRVD